MPWALAIARRLSIDEQRRARRNVLTTARNIEDGVAEPSYSELEELVHAKELAGRVQEGLGRLTRSQRAAFELMRLDGLTHSEAAKALGITISALKVRAHRAYVALRSILLDDDRGPDSAVTRA